MEHVFISYTQPDRNFAHLIADELARWGITASIDERLDTLRNWPPSIQESIKACPVFLLVMSPEARTSGWVQKEVECAKSMRKLIVPLLLRGDAWGSFTSPRPVDVRNGRMPDRGFYLKMQEVLSTSRPAPMSPPLVDAKKRMQIPPAPNRQSISYQPVMDTLAALAKRSGHWKLGEYLIDVSGSTLTVRLTDDQVNFSGGKALHPNDRAKELGPTQLIPLNYEQGAPQRHAGYKLTVNSAAKYMDAAILMIKLYKASGLNPNVLLLEPMRMP